MIPIKKALLWTSYVWQMIFCVSSDRLGTHDKFLCAESSTSESEEEDAPYIRAQSGRNSNMHAGSVLSLMLPRNKIQRRATVSGYISTYKHVPVGIELFRAQIQREMQRRGLQCPAKTSEDSASLRLVKYNFTNLSKQ